MMLWIKMIWDEELCWYGWEALNDLKQKADAIK